ncbi:MAG: hypothetical protein ABFS02_01020 [Pseudomonadota bacterium]
MKMKELKEPSVNVADVKDTLKLYAALALVLQVGLGSLVVAKPNPTVQLIAVLGMIVVFALMVLIAGRNWESVRGNVAELEHSLTPLWGEEHLPLDSAHVIAIEGVWWCQWLARTSSGKSKPYIDDTITVSSVDPATGEVSATASGVYEKDPTGYKLSGRLSKQGLVHLYYKFPPPHEEKVGMVILRFDFLNELGKGWWLGGGRGHGAPDVGGLVTWTKANAFSGEWVDRVYEWKDE